MDVAIVAPCAVPYVRGGAENLWRGLQDHLNEHTPHQAEIIKLPTREHDFWKLLDAYRRFAALDLHEFDVVVSGKYPAWLTPHPRHLVYMLHPLRGLYETYHFFNLPDTVATPPAPVAELLAFCAAHPRDRGALDEFFARVDGIAARINAFPPDLFAFPGPLIRALVQWLDGVALHDAVRYGAISRTVAERPGYFPPGADVFVAHPPSPIRRSAGGRRGEHLLAVGRMDPVKRTDLLVEAMGLTRSGATLRIAGAGPEEANLVAQAAGRSNVRFEGRVSDEALADLYARARAIVFTAYDEDFGLVALEGMQSARPVITFRDSGGATELIEDGVSGLVVEPDASALAAAIDRLWTGGSTWRRMGKAAQARASQVSWDHVVGEIEALAAPA